MRSMWAGGGESRSPGIGLSRILLLLAALAPAGLHAAALQPDVEGLVGSRFEYVVRKGDSITAISARYAVSERALIRDNRLKPPYRIRAGDTLLVHNRHLVPERLAEGIVINLPQRMLFLFSNGRMAVAYAVAAGRPDWRTPTGTYAIATLERDKPWIVPQSIQEEMRAQGKPVAARVPPGPGNPLGRYWIGLTLPGYGIHGTNAPASIYYLRTHGCIRVHPEDVEALYGEVALRLPVKIIYAHTLLARLPDGRIVAEVNRDFYEKGGDPLELMRSAARAQGLEAAIDWRAAESVARARLGQAQEIGETAAEAPVAGAPASEPAQVSRRRERVAGCDGGVR